MENLLQDSHAVSELSACSYKYIYIYSYSLQSLQHNYANGEISYVYITGVGFYYS